MPEAEGFFPRMMAYSAEEMAAYGRFLIMYAALDEQLSKCVVSLLRSPGSDLVYDLVSRIPFAKRLDIVKQAVANSHVVRGRRAGRKAGRKSGRKAGRETELILDSLDIGNLKGWRDDRVHAKVKIEDGSTVLVDHDGKRLSLDCKICEEKTEEARRATVTLANGAPQLADILEVRDYILNWDA